MKKIITAIAFMLLAPCFAVDLDKNLNEKVGQLIITGFNGNSIKSKGFKRVLGQVEKGEIGGVIFFEDNIKNKEEFIKMTSALKNSKAKYVPFISIDMEGGIIQRMNSKNGFKNFKTAKEVSKLSEKEAYNHYFEMAKMLKEANINFNFAPVVDLSINKKSIIEKKERSFSSDPEVVAKYAKTFIDSHYDNKIITSIKHFPGHGSPTGDTHEGFVDSTKTYVEAEFEPYLELSNLNDLQTVMVSHVYNKNFDDKYPASLSAKTIEQLKTKANFKGVIVSDDFDMGAIKNNYKLDEITALALSAGDNILIFSNRKKQNSYLAKNIAKYAQKGIKQGKIKPDDIDNSFNKVVKLKSLLN